MNHPFLDHLLSRGVENGRQRLADVIRTLVYRAAPEQFDGLDYADDDGFLEPLLFAHFTADGSACSLMRLLYGRLSPTYRPPGLPVLTDAAGVFHVPDVGWFETAERRAVVELRSEAHDDSYRCLLAGREIPFRLRRPHLVSATAIEILPHADPLLPRFFTNQSGERVAVDVAEPTRRHRRHVENALRLLGLIAPAYYRAVAAVTRGIVIYRGGEPNSFATLSVHGTAFLNANGGSDEVFFLEDIAHQCGHIVFNTAAEKGELLAIDPDTPLGRITGDPNEPRSVYSAVHGLFTYTAIGRVLGACWDAGVFTDRQGHELRGRVAFILAKFRDDLANLDRRSVFNDAGRAFYRECREVYCDLWQRYGDRCECLDLSNQPYVFSYDRFAARNPRPRRLRPAAGIAGYGS